MPPTPPLPRTARRVAVALRRTALDPRLRGVAAAAPRTVGFATGSLARRRPTSAGLVAQVALDEVVISVMKQPRLLPRRDDYLRAAEETAEAVALYADRGWLGDPAGYHRAPPPLSRWQLAPERRAGTRLEHLRFASDYEPHAGEPGRDRWLAHRDNRTAHAWVLRAQDPRRWLVCLHGFGMGTPATDLRAFRAVALHRRLGLNVVLPVLPLHGPRSASARSGERFMTFDLVDTVHGMAQIIWELRRLLGWLRDLGAERIGLYGLSLGGYATALAASLVEGVDCAIAGVPPVDIPALYRHHAPPEVRRRARAHDLLGDQSVAMHRVVSPLAVRPAVPHGDRYIFAGLGDRMAPAWHARRLWHHWDEPRAQWYRGGHVGFFWSRPVSRFVDEALRDSGLGAA